MNNVKNMKLTNDDVNSIQMIVNYINDYYKDIWTTFEKTIIIRRKNYNKNNSKFYHMSRVINSNHKYNFKLNDIDYLFNPTLNREAVDDIASEPIDLFKSDCNSKRRVCFKGYQAYLVGMLYHYLYKNYGKGIPDKLDKYLDYRAIYQNSKHVFTNLGKWWNYFVGNRSIAEYTNNQNNIQAQKAKVQYIKKSKQRMQWLVEDNSFKHSSKRIVRIIKGSDDDGFDFDEKYSLGVKSINALLFWLTKYQKVGIKPKDELYKDYQLQKGNNVMLNVPAIKNIRLNKNDSFTITFETGVMASLTIKALKQYRYDTIYPQYQNKVSHVPQYIQQRINQVIKDSTSHDYHLVNYNINKDYTKDTHDGYNVLNLLKKYFNRYVQNIARNHVQYNFNNFATPESLTDVKEYWYGIQIGLRALSYEPIRNTQICMNDIYEVNPIDYKKPYQDIKKNLNSDNYYRSMGLTNIVKAISDKLGQSIKKHDIVPA